MAENSTKPVLLNPQTGRSYYGKALGGAQSSEELWTDRPYQSGYETSHPWSGRMATAGLAAAGYAGLRSSPWAWNTMTQVARLAEDTLLPYRWGRTFQVSNILSHREKAAVNAQSGAGTFFRLGTPENPDLVTGEYLSSLSGNRATPEAITDAGVTFRNGKLYLGNQSGGNVLLEHAGVFLTQEGASNTVGKSYSRVNISGADAPDPFNKLKVPVRGSSRAGSRIKDLTGELDRPSLGNFAVQFQGGQTAFQYHWRRAKAIGAEFGIYRFNSLLTSDFTDNAFTKPIADLLTNIPYAGKFFQGDWKGLGVKATTPLSTAWRLGKKLAVLGTAVPLAYDQLDWTVEQIVGKGVTESVADVGVAAHLGYAHTLNFLSAGLAYDLQEGLENWVPGLTNPYNLPKFALGGFLTAGIGMGMYERVQAFRRTDAKVGDAGFWDKYTESRANLSKRYTDFAFEPGHELGGWFTKWSTARDGSIFKDDNTWKGNLWRSMHSRMKKTSGDSAVDVLQLGIPTPFGKINLGRATVGKTAGLIGAMIGGVLGAPGLLGGIIPDERPDELEAIYSGRQEVAIRKGRFWEFGRGSYEGDEIMYYRPHAYARMKSKYKEKAIWQDDYDLSPIRKAFVKNFTYELERKHFDSRPYPSSSLPFEDVAFLGPVLSNTIGRIIKPVVSMHSDEWSQDGQVKVTPAAFGKSYATELGETPGGVPISASGIQQSTNKIFYRMTEQAGLWGYALESMIHSFTGTPGIFDQNKVEASFGDVTSTSRDFYDKSLGGMMMTNEAFRRLYPSQRKYMDYYNPIENTMPSWLPGPGSRGIDFQTGDPYTKIQEGEYRLPGRGYEARFSDLEGLDPEEYPLIHRFKILADVAPHSREFKSIAQQIQSENLNSFDQSIYDSTIQQLENKRQRIEFSEYRNSLFGQGDKYGSEESSQMLAAINRQYSGLADETTGPIGAVGSFLEGLLHLQLPWDNLLPMSPESKFNPRRTAIESYERNEVYGTKSAFWNKPFENFIRPTMLSTANFLGWQGTPEKLNRTRDIEEYFDILSYVKNARLANIASMSNDEEARLIFERNKNETLFGLNPYTQNDSYIYRALPSRDKAYFKAFSEADTPGKRKRVLELVPRNQRQLYLARWQLEQTQDLRQAAKQLATQSQEINAISDTINSTYEGAKTEGFPKSQELYQMYLQTKYPGENYPDWYRRTQLMPEVPLPGADWVGWHPSVDLEDIKLKMALDAGENMHDYGFYDTQLRALGSKPFLTQAATELLEARHGMADYPARRRISELFEARRMQAEIGITRQWGPGLGSDISLELEQ